MRVIILSILSLCFAFAKLEDYRISTWNLQGSSASTESKWNVSIRQLLSGENGSNILLIQEAGHIPSTATHTGRFVQPGGTPIEEYQWELGTRTRPCSVYIYHANIDVGSRRVNLAIVTTTRADDVIVVQQDSIAQEVSRPAVGIRIGEDVFFNLHALASGGGDAAALVTAIYDRMQNSNYNWMIAGDFNRPPADLLTGIPTRVSNNIRILAPTSATHFSQSSGRENRILDYAIVGRSNRVVTANQPMFPNLFVIPMTPSVVSHLVSDHRPIQFRSF